MYVIIFIILLLVLIKLLHKFSTGMCKCKDRMDNKVVIITGSNTGIGFETAKDLAKRGAKVILACRDENKGNTARNQIINSTGNPNIIYKHLDLASFKSVREFAEDIMKTESKLDVLINNAGAGDDISTLTEDNLPIKLQVNYFSPFLLTITLLPLLKASAPSRIINISSILHILGKIDVDTFNKPITSFIRHVQAYSNSKLAVILFTRKLSDILQGTVVTANCLDPGAVNTNIFQYLNFLIRFLSLFFKTAYEGAQTSIHLAVSREVKEISGRFFKDCHETRPSSKAEDIVMADRLWKFSESVVAL